MTGLSDVDNDRIARRYVRSKVRNYWAVVEPPGILTVTNTIQEI